MTRRKSRTNKQYDQTFKEAIKEKEIVTEKFAPLGAVHPLTPNQKAYVDSMRTQTITICTSPAGAGKSLLSLYEGVKSIYSSSSTIEKIVYVRANLGMKFEMELGAMPGDYSQKISPLTLPILDNLKEFMPLHKAEAMLRDNLIEVSPISMLRGRSFTNTFLILDEAQNCPLSALKTVVTRLGRGTVGVIIGDLAQSDLRVPNGLREFKERLWGLEGVGIVEMNRSDIRRSGLIGSILARLEDYEY